MALKKCKECTTEISSTAMACPKCGAKVPKTGLLAKGCLVMILLFVGIGVLAALVGKRGAAPTTAVGTPSVAGTQQPNAVSPPAEAPHPLEVRFHDANPKAQCRGLGDAFSTQSEFTELQLDEIFASMKDEVFQYDARMKAVEVTFGHLSLQVSCKKKRGRFEFGSDLILRADDSFKPDLVQLHKEAELTVCGRFTSYTRFTGLHGELIAIGPCPNATLVSPQ